MRLITILCICVGLSLPLRGQMVYPGSQIGSATTSVNSKTYTLENNVLRISFGIKNNHFQPVSFSDKVTQQTIEFAEDWFSLKMNDDSVLSSDQFQLKGVPDFTEVQPKKDAATYALRQAGKILNATFFNSKTGLTIKWQAILTDGANYVKQKWSFESPKTMGVSRIELLKIPSAEIKQIGSVDGSPIVDQQMFFALEHPMAKDSIESTQGVAYLPLLNGIQKNKALTATTAMGVTPEGQMRRGFLYYIERERAHPYRPYLHYNSWYDLSWDNLQMNDQGVLDRIKTYGDSLITKRGVPLKAFLLDDGWDNHKTLWEVNNTGFPKGFTPEKEAAAQYKAHLGLWLSPWGGYGEPHEQRIKYGLLQKPPFEINANGFSLAGPVYFNRFRGVTTSYVKNYGVSIFKFDGVGAGNGASGAGVKYQADIDALLKLTRDLRAVEPDIFLSLTVGTWPSPYWLYYGDSTWRAGGDSGFAGTGSKRQQWITYRDAESYKNIVKRAPLYPLNSVMLHGITIAENGYPKELGNDINDIRDGIWAFFASGTDLQELYIDPHLLTNWGWDILASAAKWANENASVLQDTHWVGGDPADGEVYGYASWSPEKGILSLRNPTGESKTFIADLQTIFELPAGAPRNYLLKSVTNPKDSPIEYKKEHPVAITLAPYGMRIWEATPEN